MANEAYRAVFLRVHPTGKMVLSLTTESDGNEAQYAQLVADELGVPALDVKVVPADTDRFGVGHGYNTSPSDGTPAAIVSATEKIRARRSCSPGWRSTPRPRRSTWSNGAWVSGDGSDPTQVEDDRGHRALRARHRRAAARSRGRARRADRLRATEAGGRLAASVDLDLVGDLQRAEQRRVRLDAPVALLDDGAWPLSVPSAPSATSNAIGRVLPSSVSSPCT